MKSVPFRERLYCSINEACEAIGFGRSKIYDLIKNERIRTIESRRPDENCRRFFAGA